MPEKRVKLEVRDGLRFRCHAVVVRFGGKATWRGVITPTILLGAVKETTSGELLTDHLWCTTGRWSATLRPGDEFEFDARVSRYVKGYKGRREVPEAPLRVDYRLGRPTKIWITKRYQPKET